MPLKKSHQKTTQPGDGVLGHLDPDTLEKDQGRMLDPDNLKVELNQQNEAFKKILSRLGKKPKREPGNPNTL